MHKRKVTCPVTGHLEEIEYEVDPETGLILGITRCSAFTPSDVVRCEELCARRLNQRVRRARGVGSATGRR